MLRNLSGSFSIHDSSFVLGAVIDDGTPDGNSHLTTGAQVAELIQIQAQAQRPWTIFAYSITVSLWLTAVVTGKFYGELWKLIGGIVPNIDDMPGGGRFRTYREIPASALPFVSVIWDGLIDPTPPQAAPIPLANGGNGLMETQTVTLPQPLEIDKSQRMGFGLWIPPTVMANQALLVIFATYNITYDDGF